MHSNMLFSIQNLLAFQNAKDDDDKGMPINSFPSAATYRRLCPPNPSTIHGPSYLDFVKLMSFL